jgi:hypothetical protein
MSSALCVAPCSITKSGSGDSPADFGKLENRIALLVQPEHDPARCRRLYTRAGTSIESARLRGSIRTTGTAERERRHCNTKLTSGELNSGAHKRAPDYTQLVGPVLLLRDGFAKLVHSREWPCTGIVASTASFFESSH